MIDENEMDVKQAIETHSKKNVKDGERSTVAKPKAVLPASYHRRHNVQQTSKKYYSMFLQGMHQKETYLSRLLRIVARCRLHHWIESVEMFSMFF